MICADTFIQEQATPICSPILPLVSNGGISERSQIIAYPTKVPYAFRASKQFADNNGVVIRHGECIEIVVRDNLIDNDFTKFVCLIHGHVVEE